ncbi:MAG: hypothetical protein Tsb0013_14300 [Phycisphaerales bacterium]
MDAARLILGIIASEEVVGAGGRKAHIIGASAVARMLHMPSMRIAPASISYADYLMSLRTERHLEGSEAASSVADARGAEVRRVTARADVQRSEWRASTRAAVETLDHDPKEHADEVGTTHDGLRVQPRTQLGRLIDVFG